MKTPFKTLFADKIIFISFVGSVIFFTITLIVVAISYHGLPAFLPLYNKLAWGYARLGHTYEIGIPIALPLALSLMNVFLAKYLYEKTLLLSRFLSLITLLLSLFTCIFIVKLVLIIL